MADEDYWNESDLSKRSLNFFSDEASTKFPNIAERVFLGESNTIEHITEKPQNLKFVTQPLPNSIESESVKNVSDLPVVPQKSGTEKQRMEELNPRAMVLRIILGESYSLDMYKSREDKLMMLDEAIKSCDGNAILVIVLFLERTMKPGLFNLEMTRRPIAVEQYLSYLQLEASSAKLFDALSMFHKTEQAAIQKFKLSNNSSSSTKTSNLHKCLISHFQTDANLSFEASIIQHHINLLELQAPIQEHDEKEVLRGSNALMREIPPSVSLVGTSALTTLYYSCLYHFEKPENFLGSPLSVKKSQQLSEKQFIWKAISSLARLKRWTQIDALFMTKSWTGGSKMKSPVPFERIVSLLHQTSAPREMKGKYCLLINDVNRRIEVATKYECHEVVLLTYKELRNKDMIEKYRINLKSKTPEDYLASEILNDKAIKWKN